METLSEAMARLQESGYQENYRAEAGRLVCGRCGVSFSPGSTTIDEVVRFEGASDPGDESVLYALDAGCGHRGLFAAAYGPNASDEDAVVLLELPDATPPSAPN